MGSLIPTETEGYTMAAGSILMRLLEVLRVLPDEAAVFVDLLREKYPDAAAALEEFIEWGIAEARAALGEALPDEATVRAILTDALNELWSGKPGTDTDSGMGA